MDQLNAELRTKVEDWLRWNRNEPQSDEIRQLVAVNDAATLRSRLAGRLAFGTAGLRGRMQAGFAAMNDLVVLQTAQGLAAYVRSQFPAELACGVVVGYDGRHNSRRFAELTSACFLAAGIPVRLFSQLVPTPFVAFAIQQLGCLCGVMVTASHNPREDNGYKVYWRNGAQIIGPHDKAIEQSIREHLEPRAESWLTEAVAKSPLVCDPLADIWELYNSQMMAFIPAEVVVRNRSSGVRFVYSAMHGVGYDYVQSACACAGLQPFVPVAEQCKPDPDFSTVRLPNPEEPDSLRLAMKCAEAQGIGTVIANDPDADRVAVAQRHPRTHKWRVYTGNELGALLGWWVVQHLRQQYTENAAQDCYLLSSAVSSHVARSLAVREGMRFEETLTGFKWMGNRAAELAQQGKRVVFAFEEAIGFMVGDAVLDKDGVSAAVHLAAMITWLTDVDKCETLDDQLQRIYAEYSTHNTYNSYFECHEAKVIAAIFERIRAMGGGDGTGPLKKYPARIDAFRLASVRDLTTGYDSQQPNGKPLLPCSSSAQMITFNFTGPTEIILTLRTSGTEPKIKFYSESISNPTAGGENAVAQMQAQLVAAVNGMVEQLLQPELNGLVAQHKWAG